MSRSSKLAKMSVTGKFSEYNEDVEDLSNYLERFELYIKANSVKDTEKVPLFLTVIGPKNYAVLKNLLLPKKLADESYDDLVKALKGHFAPEKSIISERCKFHKRFQKEGETLAQYAVEIKHLAAFCEFGSFLNDAMRDRFVSGIKNEDIQQRLMTEKDSTFSQLFELACRLEAARQEVKGFHSQGEVSEIDFVKSYSGRHRPKHSNIINKNNFSTKPKGNYVKNSSQPENRKEYKCYRCGKIGHNCNACFFKNSRCHSCGKIGHLSNVCRQKPALTNESKSRGNRLRVNYVTESSNEEINTCYDLQCVSLISEVSFENNFRTTLMIENKPLEMVIDTGAIITVLPKYIYDDKFSHIDLGPTELQLKSYTGHPLDVMGEFKASVCHEGQDYNLPIVVVGASDQRQPALLGRNWLQQLKLDWNRIFQVGPGNTGKSQHNVSNLRSSPNIDIELKSKFKDVFEGQMGLIKGITTDISVDEDATPIFCKARPVPYALRDVVERELDNLVKSDVIYPVKDSQWSTPLVCVLKPDGKSVRLCGDFKVTLNRVLKNSEHYPLPTPEDIFTKLSGGKVFSKIDLTSAYLQLGVGERSQPFLTVNTHRGLFRYKRLPFGITSAPFQFQAVMDSILRGLEGTYCFLDDILVVGQNKEDAVRKTKALLQRLLDFGIKANYQKSEFLKPSLDFLGHRIDELGIHPTDKLVKAILDAPEPTNVTQLRAYLGLLNFYGRFLPNLSTTLYPLHQLLQKNKLWVWDTKCSKVFEESKMLLTQSNVLVPYNPKLKIQITCDASPYGIASVMSHIMNDGSIRPVAYASRSLTKSEMNYAQLDKEALAIIYGVKKFHKYIFGRSFTLVTDHAPLTALLGEKKGIPVLAAARMQRWAIILSAYDYHIIYRKGSDIVEADALSRLPKKLDSDVEEHTIQFFAPFPELPLTAREIGLATRRDPIFSKVLDLTLRGWPQSMDKDDQLRCFFMRKNEFSVENDCVLWGNRVVIPSKFQKHILGMLHEEHPGVCKMKALARSFVWWPKMDEQIENLVKSCSICQMTRKSAPKVPLQPWTWPSKKWQRVHLDFAMKNGIYFLVLVDSFSKWVEVFQMNGTNAAKTIEKLRSCFAAYGIPEHIITDGGPPFRSEEFESFLRSNGIDHIFSPPYHPASNGQAESMVGTFKTSLLKQVLQDNLKGHKRTLQHKLDSFLFSYRNTPHSITGKPPAELFLGFQPRTRFTLLKPDFQRSMVDKQEKIKKSSDKSRGPWRSFTLGQEVMVRSVRNEEIKWMPGMVVKKISPVTYVVSVLGQKRFVHADHLKEVEHEFPNLQEKNPSVYVTPSRPIPILSPTKISTAAQTPPSPVNINQSPVRRPSPPTQKSPSPRKPTDQETLRRSKRVIKAPQKLTF